MKIAAICCTYKRPRELAEAIESFLRQDYPAALRELVVLDDAGQYSPGALAGFANVKLVTTVHRFRTLGEKRNAAIALASKDVDAYCVWDDDDIYLPWHISAAAAKLDRASYTIPSRIYVEEEGGLRRGGNKHLFHAAWAFRRTAFVKAGGYPFMQNGEDQGLLGRFMEANLRKADPLLAEPRASYIFRWFTSHSQHISVSGKRGYESLGAVAAPKVRSLTPGWSKDWLGLHRQWQQAEKLQNAQLHRRSGAAAKTPRRRIPVDAHLEIS